VNFAESIVEDAALSWFKELDYAVAHGPHIAPDELHAERKSFSEAVLAKRLRDALAELNPKIPVEALDDAFRKVTVPQHPSLIANNRALHRMLVEGISVECSAPSPRPSPDGRGKKGEGEADNDLRRRHEIVRLIDWENPDANDWLVVNQFTVIEGQINRRPDIVVFVNGLPLAVIELKNASDENATIWSAFQQLQTYKAQIPSLLAYNAALIISDGIEARIGTISSNVERFMPWRTITGEQVEDYSPPSPRAPLPLGEGRKGEGFGRKPELEVLLRGVFEKRRFLDLVRHFIVFEDEGGGQITKKLAGYHQFHAVNIAVEETIRASSQTAIDKVRDPGGGYFAKHQAGGEAGDRRIGVIWHTQGSGKSLTMAFYAGRLVLSPAMENPTIVVITDRNDLDDQLFGTFSRCHELLRQSPQQAQSREHLRELLKVASGGVVFTTVHKFMPSAPSSLRPSPTGRRVGVEGAQLGGAGAQCEGRKHYRGGYDFSGLVQRARELRQEQTPAEKVMWYLLRNRQLMGFKFRRQHQIGDYICDFHCDEAKLVVECDGEPHEGEKMQRHDHKRDAYLRSLGLTVLRFRNDAVLNETENVLSEIAANLPSASGRGVGGEGDASSLGAKHPLLSDRRNIVVIADEAHRSQYDFIDGFARHMREALPNASWIGFTGTPIEKTDANTRAVFGDYVSIYDILRAVEDKATVPIYYESRLAKLALDDKEKPKIDPNFEEATEGEEVEKKERLKTKWAPLEAVVGAEKRLELIAEDLVRHWETRLEAMDGKAMIVCMSRRICVELYEAIRKLRPDWHNDDDGKGVMKIVMTGSATDPLEWQGHIRSKERREKLANRFKDAKDHFKIVFVRDMWLTGFDVPSLHTMYVDKPMRGHGLMQAIARVNRVFKDKPGGLVVDYLGLANELKQALATYTESGGHGETAVDQEKAVAVMMEKYEVCKAFFHKFDWSKWTTGTPAERLNRIPAGQEHILKPTNDSTPDEKKSRYLQAVTDLSKAFALSVPHERAIAIRDDVGFFQAVRAALAKSSPDRQRSPQEIDAAIRQIISRAVAPDEVVDIFAAAGLKKPDISILSDEFLAEVKDMPHKNLAVETLRKLLNDEIKVRRKKFLIQSRKFSEMLEASIRKYQNRAIEAAAVIEELIGLAKDIREANKRGEDLKLTDDELAFYDALEVNDSAVKVLGEPTLTTIARELVEAVRNSVTIDWTEREAVRAKIRVMVKRILRKYGYPPDKQEKATATVLSQAELLCKDWAN